MMASVNLFSRTPRELRDLEKQIISARASFALASRLDPAQRDENEATAAQWIEDALATAIAAGHTEQARAMLERYELPPETADNAAAGAWSDLVASARARLGAPNL